MPGAVVNPQAQALEDDTDETPVEVESGPLVSPARDPNPPASAAEEKLKALGDELEERTADALLQQFLEEPLDRSASSQRLEEIGGRFEDIRASMLEAPIVPGGPKDKTPPKESKGFVGDLLDAFISVPAFLVGQTEGQKRQRKFTREQLQFELDLKARVAERAQLLEEAGIAIQQEALAETNRNRSAQLLNQSIEFLSRARQLKKGATSGSKDSDIGLPLNPEVMSRVGDPRAGRLTPSDFLLPVAGGFHSKETLDKAVKLTELHNDMLEEDLRTQFKLNDQQIKEENRLLEEMSRQSDEIRKFVPEQTRLFFSDDPTAPEGGQIVGGAWTRSQLMAAQKAHIGLLSTLDNVPSLEPSLYFEIKDGKWVADDIAFDRYLRKWLEVGGVTGVNITNFMLEEGLDLSNPEQAAFAQEVQAQGLTPMKAVAGDFLIRDALSDWYERVKGGVQVGRPNTRFGLPVRDRLPQPEDENLGEGQRLARDAEAARMLILEKQERDFIEFGLRSHILDPVDAALKHKAKQISGQLTRFSITGGLADELISFSPPHELAELKIKADEGYRELKRQYAKWYTSHIDANLADLSPRDWEVFLDDRIVELGLADNLNLLDALLGDVMADVTSKIRSRAILTQLPEVGGLVSIPGQGRIVESTKNLRRFKSLIDRARVMIDSGASLDDVRMEFFGVLDPAAPKQSVRVFLQRMHPGLELLE